MFVESIRCTKWYIKYDSFLKIQDIYRVENLCIVTVEFQKDKLFVEFEYNS